MTKSHRFGDITSLFSSHVFLLLFISGHKARWLLRSEGAAGSGADHRALELPPPSASPTFGVSHCCRYHPHTIPADSLHSPEAVPIDTCFFLLYIYYIYINIRCHCVRLNVVTVVRDPQRLIRGDPPSPCCFEASFSLLVISHLLLNCKQTIFRDKLQPLIISL